MSVTGPGCAHCARGRVTTPDGDRRPCDRCGGWSQFARLAPDAAAVLDHFMRENAMAPVPTIDAIGGDALAPPSTGCAVDLTDPRALARDAAETMERLVRGHAATATPADYDARHMRLMRERDEALHRAETAEGLLAVVLAAIRREHNARAAWLASLPDGSCGNPPSQALPGRFFLTGT